MKSTIIFFLISVICFIPLKGWGGTYVKNKAQADSVASSTHFPQIFQKHGHTSKWLKRYFPKFNNRKKTRKEADAQPGRQFSLLAGILNALVLIAAAIGGEVTIAFLVIGWSLLGIGLLAGIIGIIIASRKREQKSQKCFNSRNYSQRNTAVDPGHIVGNISI